MTSVSMPTSFEALLSRPIELRDSDWESQVLREIPLQSVRLVAPEPLSGPDGWPYLPVETGPQADEPVARIMDWLSTRGIGLVLNPGKSTPDMVLTYGMVWNYLVRGSILSDSPNRKSGEFHLTPGSQIFTGAPSEGFLPKYARRILRQFFLDQGLYSPKVLMITQNNEDFDLCFSIESLGHPPQHEHMGIAEAVSWFLPAHYSVALMSEKSVLGFEAL